MEHTLSPSVNIKKNNFNPQMCTQNACCIRVHFKFRENKNKNLFKGEEECIRFEILATNFVSQIETIFFCKTAYRMQNSINNFRRNNFVAFFFKAASREYFIA